MPDAIIGALVGGFLSALLTAAGAFLLFEHQQEKANKVARNRLSAELQDLPRHLDRNFKRLTQMEENLAAGVIPDPLHVLKLAIRDDSPLLSIGIIELANQKRYPSLMELRRLALNFNEDLAYIAMSIKEASVEEVLDRVFYIHDRMKLFNHMITNPNGERNWVDKRKDDLLVRIVPSVGKTAKAPKAA